MEGNFDSVIVSIISLVYKSLFIVVSILAVKNRVKGIAALRWFMLTFFYLERLYYIAVLYIYTQQN